MNRASSDQPRSIARRGFFRRAAASLLAAAATLAANGAVPAAMAQARHHDPGRGRLDPGERDRLRRDLRERGFEGWPRRETATGTQRDSRARERPRDAPGRLSDDERRQLRRQLREADRWRN